MGTKPTIMFYVQHLLGIGHVFRAMRVAKGLARAGCETHLVWGGQKIPSMDMTGLNMHYLEAVHVANENFKALLLNDGTQMSEEVKQARADHLLQIFDEVEPDIVITEAYPFGRRQMRFELIPLMEKVKSARPKPLMVCSIRDIMQENRAPKRVRESIDAIHTWFDLVMVHGDPTLIPIESTLEKAEEITDKIRYTGLVTPDAVDKTIPPSVSPAVIVSAGGGAVGKALMNTAVEAMQYCKKYPENWCLTTGPDLPQNEFDEISGRAPASMQVTRFIPDLTNVMATAKVSVSRAGYNTLGDVLRAGCSAVLVPFAGGVETEQLRRAKVMCERGLATMLLDDDMTPQSLARAIDQAAILEKGESAINMDGANTAAQLLMSVFKSHKKQG